MILGPWGSDCFVFIFIEIYKITLIVERLQKINTTPSNLLCRTSAATYTSTSKTCVWWWYIETNLLFPGPWNGNILYYLCILRLYGNYSTQSYNFILKKIMSRVVSLTVRNKIVKWTLWGFFMIRNRTNLDVPFN